LRSFPDLYEQLSQAGDHGAAGRCVVGWPNQQIDRAQFRPLEPERLADTALDRVALHCLRGMSSRDQKTQACRTFFAPSYVERVARDVAPHPLTEQPLEIALLSDPLLRAEPESRPTLASGHAARRDAYTARRLRPLARRARSTARPPRVPLRTRKPWRRVRRVFDGWYVRFIVARSEKGRY
jgi:hypothetical protein